MKDKNLQYLNKEEKEIIESFENIDVKQIKKPNESRQKELKKAAKSFLKKETKMNIRIDPSELEIIKEQAKHEGLKYQTFIKSILHKYITGQLIDRDKIIIR